MTVKQLREALSNQPDNLLVIVSRDPEGNGFSPLDADFNVGEYNSYTGDYLSHPSDRTKPDADALCLWPR